MSNANNSNNSSFIKVITHGGIFHADDVFAAAWLCLTSDTTTLSRIERRFKISQEELDDSSILVFDIGGKYSPVNNNFDHHMKDGVMRASGIPFSSFGLVFDAFPMKGMTEFVEEIIRHEIVYPIDIIDNGVGEKSELPEYSLSQVVSSFNSLDGKNNDVCFGEAVRFAIELLNREIALAEKQERDISGVLNSEVIEGKILVMDECFAGWQKTVLNEFSENMLYVIYPGLRGGYMIQCVPAEEGSFDTRKSLPKDWAGLRDAELQEKCGVEDAMFIHPGQFIGGAESVAGCLAMARLAL